MNALKPLGFLTLLFSLSLFFTACGGNKTHDHNDHSHEATETTTQHGEGKAYTAAYVCPMHCEGSGSETTGKCPVCNMDYVANAEHTKDGHKH